MKVRRIAVAITLALLLGCGSSATKFKFNIIPVEDEWQLGANLARDVAHQVQLVNDAESLAYLRDMGTRIVAQIPPSNPTSTQTWEFLIVRDEAVNAFAIPGGHIYVNTGLIKSAHNASELAGVLAHEIAHVATRHTTQQMSNEYGISTLTKAALGSNPSTYQQVLAQVLSNGALAHFNRDQEKEADDLGVHYMFGAGYDPHGMANMFRTLLAEQKSRPNAVERFFASHPLTEDRIKDVEEQASKLPKKTNLITDEQQFHTVKEKLQ